MSREVWRSWDYDHCFRPHFFKSPCSISSREERGTKKKITIFSQQRHNAPSFTSSSHLISINHKLNEFQFLFNFSDSPSSGSLVITPVSLSLNCPQIPNLPPFPTNNSYKVCRAINLFFWRYSYRFLHSFLSNFHKTHFIFSLSFMVKSSKQWLPFLSCYELEHF